MKGVSVIKEKPEVSIGLSTLQWKRWKMNFY